RRRASKYRTPAGASVRAGGVTVDTDRSGGGDHGRDSPADRCRGRAGGRAPLDSDVTARLRVVVADDERPARSFLVALLRSFREVLIVGEADSGKAAVSLIERERPD